MLEKYQFSFKIFNGQHFSFFCLILFFFTKCCICTTNTIVDLSEFGDEKVVSIDLEELVRRRNVVETYLKEMSHSEEDWIETYHNSFSKSSAFISKKTEEKGSIENEHGVDVTFPSLNVDMYSPKNLKDSFYADLPDVKNHEFNTETSVSKNALDNINKYQPAEKLIKHKEVSSEEVTDQNLLEHLKTDKNSDKNLDSFKNDFEHLTNSHSSKENSVSSMMESNCNVKDYKLDQNIKHSSTKIDDLEMNAYRNLSVNTDKFIEIKIKNSKFTSKKYFIDSETLTLTEFYKLQENLAQLSFLQNSKNNVYSVNRLKIINSIGKITSSLKQDELYQVKIKQLCKFSNTDNDPNEDNIKKSTTDFEKRVGYKIEPPLPDAANSKKLKILSNNLKNVDTNDFSHDSELLRRKKSMQSFIATLNANQKDWIETYHLNDLKHESDQDSFSPVSNNFKENKSSYNVEKTAKQYEKFSNVHSQERYIIRWINKLQNKLKDSHSNPYSLNILVSADLPKILGQLSLKFDIVTLDELIVSMITNATFHNNYENTWYLDYNSAINYICSSLNTKFIYVIIVLLCCFIFLCSMHSKHWLKWNLLPLSFVILLTFAWHANKMYQKKIAERHTVMSRVVPSYCESILVKESGILAHFKELFRSGWHDEDCKKYYEAVMVDPSAEITLLSVSSDLISDTICQMLQPFAQSMNAFFKVLLYDLSLKNQILIIFVTLVIFGAILICIVYFFLSYFAFHHKYKIRFPFNMGSTEPTEFSMGSRVEEIHEVSSLKDSNTLYNTSLVDCNNKTKKIGNSENIILQKKCFKTESKHSKLKPLKHCVSKTPRILIRRNSL